MAGNQVFNKEKKQQIRGELEDLLRGYSGNPNIEEDIVDEQMGEIAAAPPIDFDEMNKRFEKQAKDITGSMLKFYVDLGVIDNVEYVKQKQILDNTSISNIFFQLKTLRMAIEKIAEEINQGNTHPRLFEVFGQLQDKLTTVVKTQANYMLFLEDTYKKINQDVTQKGTNGASVTPLMPTEKQFYITAGTKNIMKEITAEEVDNPEVDDSRTNPTKKTELIQKFGISQDIIEDKIDDLSEDVNSLV